jgi:hypothetical protein
MEIVFPNYFPNNTFFFRKRENNLEKAKPTSGNVSIAFPREIISNKKIQRNGI